MRFRAEVKDVPALLGPLQAFERVGDLVLLVLSPESVRLMLTPDVSHTAGEQAYAEIDTESVFDNCRVESQSANRIPMLLYIPLLVHRLKACEKSEYVLLKLSKRDRRAFLTVESREGAQSSVHNLPIQLQAARRIDECDEPALDEPAVKLHMPPLRMLANVVDKMKNVSDILSITATNSGRLTLAVKQTQVTIESEFDGLRLNQSGAETPAAGGGIVAPSPALAQNLVADAVAAGMGMGMDPDGMGVGMGNGHGHGMGDGHAAGMGMGLGSQHMPPGSHPHPPLGPSISSSALESAMDAEYAASAPNPEDAPVEVKLAIKKFANMMHAKALNASFVVGCLIPGSAFVMHLRLRGKRGVVTYYLPLLNVD